MKNLWSKLVNKTLVFVTSVEITPTRVEQNKQHETAPQMMDEIVDCAKI